MDEINFDNPPTNTSGGGEVMNEVLQVPTAIMRAYFIIVFLIVLMVVITLWKKISMIQEEEENSDLPMSYRGEMLNNVLVFLAVYAFSWLPILFLGILDGELETASVSEGFKGTLANCHCAIQDLLVRCFGISIVVMVTLYLRYHRQERKEEACVGGRPNLFTWGIILPVIITESVRFLLDRKEWLMPTESIIYQIGTLKFSIKGIAPVFCVQVIDDDWLRHNTVEWFITVMLVAMLGYCCLPCFGHKEDDDLKAKKKKYKEEMKKEKKELEKNQNQSQNDSENEVDTESLQHHPIYPLASAPSIEDLEMDELEEKKLYPELSSFDENSDTSQPERQSYQGNISSLYPTHQYPIESHSDSKANANQLETIPEVSDTESSNDCNNKIEEEPEGLYATGPGLLEGVAASGVTWFLVIRPFTVLAIFAFNDGVYSNYLDIPTHVLLIIAIGILPMELHCGRQDDDDDKEQEGTIICRTPPGGGDVNALWKSEQDQIVDAIVKSEEEQRQEQKIIWDSIKGNQREDDVDPIWTNNEWRDHNHSPVNINANDFIEHRNGNATLPREK